MQLLGSYLSSPLHDWKTGYTRKLFHFLIFGTVVAAHRIDRKAHV